MRNRYALLGGSFNPVHRGHIHLFHQAASFMDIDTLIVIPAFVSNFKQGSNPALFDARLKMLELALLDYRDEYPDDNLEVEISSFEGMKGSISYTSDTIKAFFPLTARGGKVDFIIGDDILANLDKWHEFSYIKDHVRFHCFTRGCEERVTHGAEVVFYDSSVLEASSSDVRLGHGEYLSPRVRRFIDENRLYRA